MSRTIQSGQSRSIAERAWKRLESAFPSGTLSSQDGELEFSMAAPAGSVAGHLVGLTLAGDFWLRFDPPYMCYAVDNVDEMISVMEQLISDQIVFRVTMFEEKWTETTLAQPGLRLRVPKGHNVCEVSWSGAVDRTLCR